MNRQARVSAGIRFAVGDVYVIKHGSHRLPTHHFSSLEAAKRFCENGGLLLLEGGVHLKVPIQWHDTEETEDYIVQPLHDPMAPGVVVSRGSGPSFSYTTKYGHQGIDDPIDYKIYKFNVLE